MVTFFRNLFLDTIECSKFIIEYNKTRLSLINCNNNTIKNIVNAWINDFINGDPITGLNFTYQTEQLGLICKDSIVEKKIYG